MSDIVERVRIALQEVGVCLSDLEGEIERLRAALAGIIEATDLDEVSVIARRALEGKK